MTPAEKEQTVQLSVDGGERRREVGKRKRAWPHARTHGRREGGGGSAVATKDPVFFFALARMCNLCVGLVRSSLGCVCTVRYMWDVCMSGCM
jgi:hypothetical protein